MQIFKISWWGGKLFLKVKEEYRRRQKSIDSFHILHFSHTGTLMREPYDQNIDYKTLFLFFLEVKLEGLVWDEKCNILHSVMHTHSLECFLIQMDDMMFMFMILPIHNPSSSIQLFHFSNFLSVPFYCSSCVVISQISPSLELLLFFALYHKMFTAILLYIHLIPFPY